MKKLDKSILYYIINTYRGDLTISRLLGLIYLIDFYNLLETDRKYNINDSNFIDGLYYKNSYLYKEILKDKNILLKQKINAYGGIINIVTIKNKKSLIKLDESVIRTVNKIIEDTEDLSWNSFVDLIEQYRGIKKFRGIICEKMV